MCFDEGSGGQYNQDLVKFFMKQALRVAKEALDIGEVPVGCVIVLRDVADIDPSLPSEHRQYDEVQEGDVTGACLYATSSPSVIVSHGANQVNATRDATRHAEMVAIDRMLSRGRSSDQMKLPADVIRKSAHGKIPNDNVLGKESDGDRWVNVPSCENHWKNTFGWRSGRTYNKDVFSKCDLYVTCEPCIMCAAALSMVGFSRVFFWVQE
jgi:tRNA(Arg) A34 adenosine deaminase TadA